MINASADSTLSEGTEKKQRNLIPFRKGQSGNPAGRPKGSRNKLTEDFLAALADDFEAHGMEAIERCREDRPDHYIKVVASLIPKQKELDISLTEETREMLSYIQAYRIVRDEDPPMLEAEEIEEE